MLKEIGVRSASPSQLACLVELHLSSLFCCLQLFASWVRDGVHDFAALPFGLKVYPSDQDLELVKQIPLKWTGWYGKGNESNVGITINCNSCKHFIDYRIRIKPFFKIHIQTTQSHTHMHYIHKHSQGAM